MAERANVESEMANPKFCRDGGVFNLPLFVPLYLHLELRLALFCHISVMIYARGDDWPEFALDVRHEDRFRSIKSHRTTSKLE